MAEIVAVDGQQYKKRNIFGVWLGLPLITLGIYGFVWWYKINDEARRYLNDDSIKPGVALLALIPGFLLVVPVFVTIYKTAQRVQRMQEKAEARGRIEPVLALVAAFFSSLHVLYIQEMLNRVWEAEKARGSRAMSGPAPASLPPVAPPPSSVPPLPPAPDATAQLPPTEPPSS